jgi:hypothetical protein
MAAAEVRWVVRLTPPTGRTIRDLLEIPLSLDVWHREKDALVAAASEVTLRELEPSPARSRRAPLHHTGIRGKGQRAVAG